MIRVESPFPDVAVPRIWHWTEEFRRAVADDFAPKTMEEFVDDWERKLPARMTWGIWEDDTLGGAVIFEPWTPVSGVVHCVFKKTFWGRERTEVGLRLAAQELFDAGKHKLIGLIFKHNAQMLKLCEDLGFYREGKLTEVTMQDGKPVDMLILSLLKGNLK